jgi:mono/diheme cytochrome c family protein
MRKLTFVVFTLLIGTTACDKKQVEKPDASPTAERPETEGEAENSETEPDEGPEPFYGMMSGRYGMMGRGMPPDAPPAWRMQQMRRQMMHMNQRGYGWGMHHRGMMHGRRGMMRGGPPAEGPPCPRGSMCWASGMDLWHEQMADMHEQMAEEFASGGQDELAERHREIATRHREFAESLAAEAPGEPLTAEGMTGKKLFEQTCAACHGTDGEGVSEAFPPLAESAVVNGPPERLIRIALHGVIGELEVGDEKYYGAMPPAGGRLGDDAMASVLTYVRNSWGNSASEVTPEQVASVRQKYPDRASAWSTEELGIAPAEDAPAAEDE